jgi:TM2 domain-containing membrane protein YozV
MKICPSCNHKNPPVVDSCSACGASLAAPAQEAAVPAQEAQPQPMAQQPMAQQPMAQQPMAQQPMAQQPMAQQPMAQQPMQGGASSKSKTTAGVLGILIGSLGIHNFYIGKTGTGIAQLLITILSLGFLGIFVWIWAVIESIGLLQGKGIDGDGRPIVN